MTVVQDRPVSIEDRILAAKIRGSLDLYSKAVHNMDLEPYQLAWEQALNIGGRVLIVCPPDTYKSTTVQHWIEREIGHDPNSRTLWLMNAGEQAEKRVMTVASTIDSNPVYRGAFHVQPDKESQWTKSVLFVKRDRHSADPTLMGAGLNGAYQGLHFDKIIIDDPTNQEDVRSPTTMELQVSKIRGVVIDRLVEGGSIIVILTRWGDNDLVPTFKSMGFTVVEMPVISDKYPWGPTISNKRFPLTKVEQIRRDKGDALFQLTYMCNPAAMSGQIIRNIKYYDPEDLPRDHAIDFFMSVDPAISLKTHADYSAISTLGMDTRTRKKYLVDMWAARVDSPTLEEEILKRAKRIHGLRYIGVETVAYQLSIVQHLRRNSRLPLVELPYRSRRQAMRGVLGIDKDKVSRAAYLDSQFASESLYIPRDLPLLDGMSLEAELVAVPNGRHDDRMDALCFSCALADATFSTLPKVQLRSFSR